MITDRLTTSAHFIHAMSNWTASRFVKIYVKEIVRLHGVPSVIVCDRSPLLQAHSERVSRKLWVQSLVSALPIICRQIGGQSELIRYWKTYFVLVFTTLVGVEKIISTLLSVSV